MNINRREEGGAEKPKVENIDQYEREKIENALTNTKHLVEIMQIYLAMIDYCDEKGIQLEGRKMLDNITYPDMPAGPGSDLCKLISLFEVGQIQIAGNLTGEQSREVFLTKVDPIQKARELTEAIQGGDIDDAAIDGWRAAQKQQRPVIIEFKGRKVEIVPGMSLNDIQKKLDAISARQ